MSEFIPKPFSDGEKTTVLLTPGTNLTKLSKNRKFYRVGVATCIKQNPALGGALKTSRVVGY